MSTEDAPSHLSDLEDGTSQRWPPSWLPAVALGSVPVTIACAALAGLASSSWALGALALGAFLLMFLIGLWAAPVSQLGVLKAIGLGVIGMIVVSGVLIMLTRVGDELGPHEPSPSTEPSSSAPTTT